MINELPYYLLPVLFLIAVIFSSVGHGGASGYLALMALAGCSLGYAKPVALILNCLVSIIAFVQFYKAGYFNFKLFIKLAMVSVPFAYLGGYIQLDDILYKRIVGVLLLLIALRFYVNFEAKEVSMKPKGLAVAIMGMVIGFVSGLIGIGGGVFLTPLLLILGWSDMRTAACVSALFIFVNSCAGLIAQFGKGIEWPSHNNLVVMVALAGGLLGSYYGAKKWNAMWLKKVLAVALFIASLKLIFL